MSRLLVVLMLAVCLGCPPQTFAETNDASEWGDEAEIYAAFLASWMSNRGGPLNVAVKAEAPTADALTEFSECAGGARWTRFETTINLDELLGNLPHVHLVDPATWAPRDPGDLIAQGRSLESAVASGFSNGLLTLSAIVFDEGHTTAAFMFSFVCGELCGMQRSVVYTRRGGAWAESENSCRTWLSRAPDGRLDHTFRRMPLAAWHDLAG